MNEEPAIRVLQPPLSEADTQAIRDQLARVVSHPLFSNSERYPQFLHYVVEKALAQETDELKERTIGIEVFGKETDYDTSSSPVVRYCAGETRKRLALYYELQEHQHELRIEMHSGGYVPSFSVRAPAPRNNGHHKHLKLIPRSWPKENGGRSAHPRLAVLPFENLNADGNNCFTDGVTEQVIYRFGVLRGFMAVVASSSIHEARITSRNSAQLCRDLRAKFLLVGSTLRLDGQVRVNVRLVSSDGGCIWTNSYVCSTPESLAAQDQIACSMVLQIAGALRVPLPPVGEMSPAQQSLGLAMHLLEQRTESSVLRSVEQFRRTIALDNHLALAHSGLAFALITHVWLGGKVEGGHVFSLATDQAQRAIDLAPGSSWPYLVMATLQHSYDFNDAAAVENCRRALLAEPHSIHANLLLAFLHTTNARYGEALNTALRARQSNPFSAYVQNFIAFNNYCSGSYEDAIQAAESALQLDNNFPIALSTLGMALEEAGHADTAVERYRYGLRLHPSSQLFLSHLGRAYALQGKKEDASRILQELIGGYRQNWSSSYPIAAIYNALGKTNDAQEWLEQAFEDRCFSRVMCRVDPRFENLRDTPRFRNMILKAQDGVEAEHKLLTYAIQ